jgi:hypothetical protein
VRQHWPSGSEAPVRKLSMPATAGADSKTRDAFARTLNMVLDHQERTHIKNILSIAIIDAVGSYGYTQYQEASHRAIEESLSDSERGPRIERKLIAIYL